MSEAPCEISVVISTYNRASQLAKALDALLAQAAGVEYEVIVVDNNSTDETKDVAIFRLNRSGRLKYIFGDRPCRAGLSADPLLFQALVVLEGIARARLEELYPISELGIDVASARKFLDVPRFMWGSAVRDAVE